MSSKDDAMIFAIERYKALRFESARDKLHGGFSRLATILADACIEAAETVAERLVNENIDHDASPQWQSEPEKPGWYWIQSLPDESESLKARFETEPHQVVKTTMHNQWVVLVPTVRDPHEYVHLHNRRVSPVVGRPK